MSTELIVDVDVHHIWSSEHELLSYMADEWKPYFKGGAPSAAHGRFGRFFPPLLWYPKKGSYRPETTPPGGGPPGSHYETLRDLHLDPHHIDRALLTWNAGMHAALFNAQACVELCRAANDYMMDYWLNGRDERLYGTLCVPVGVPEEAAKEVRRLGGHPRIAGVLVAVNPFGKPLGHPVYHPIFEAAVEHNLPVLTHLGSDVMNKGGWAASGLPTTRIEYDTLSQQPAMHHLSSLLCEGVFETFPTLRVLINECGFTWMPWLLWSLDSRYEILKREHPNLRRLPSEYFCEHIWASTQPFVSEAETDREVHLLEAFGGMEDRLCYASDYPHWDAEWPDHVVPRLPKSWRAKVMGENAACLFGWSLESRPAGPKSDVPAAAGEVPS